MKPRGKPVLRATSSAMGVLIDMFTRGGPVRPKAVLDAVARDPACCKDVDTTTGNTPLHFTCCNGAPIELVRALLRAYPGAASVEDGDGNLPLHGACSCGAAPDVIEMLLEANPGAARHLANGQTPLHYACCHQCDPRVAKLLIDRYPEACGVQDRDGNAPLHFALIRSAHPAVVQLLVKTHPLACAMRGFLGRLPLSLALLYEAHPSAIKAVRDAYPDASRSVWKSKFYSASVLNRCVDLHAIDAPPARWRAPTPSTRR